MSGIRAIILMGGVGERFGSRIPKQFHRLVGKKIYLHTLEKFLKTGLFEEILLVAPRLWLEDVKGDVQAFPQVRVIEGGSTRRESSWKALLACPENTEIVVIHDAVRPFVSERILRQNIEKAVEVGAVDTCIPSADTLVYAPQGSVIENIPVRAHYLRGQTPQSFRFALIKEAHEKGGLLEGISDDCRLVAELKAPIAVVLGEERNIKITSSLDLLLAEQLVRDLDPISTEMRDLTGLKVAITGGTGGIGQAVAELLREQGAIPIPLARTTVHAIDFSELESIIHGFDTLYQDEGPVDALINCIGHLERASILEQSDVSINRQIDLNIRSVIFSCKYAKIKEGGQIINVASSAYAQGRQDMAVYAAAKAAVVNFTQGFALERPDLILNTIAPQRTDTPMRKTQFPDEDPSTLLSSREVALEIVDLLRRAQKFHEPVIVRKNSPLSDKN